MQQWQNKSKTQTKENNSFAKMMMQRDKTKIQDKKRKELIEILKKPRSKEYMFFLNKKLELEKNICNIDDEIQKLEKEMEQFSNEEISVENATKIKEIEEVSNWQETEEKLSAKKEETVFNWWETEEKPPAKKEETVSNWWETEEKTLVEISAKKEESMWWNSEKTVKKDSLKEFSQKMEKKRELERQRQQIVQEWEEASRQLEQQLPVPDKVIGMVYYGMFFGRLKKWGIVSVPGTAYQDPQELLELTNPKSEEIAERWIKGDQALHNSKAILVEIYMGILCLVHYSGEVDVIEE